MSEVTLRDVQPEDIAAFWAWQTDPVSTAMAAFAPDDVDLDAFRARWERIQADPNNGTASIVSDGELAGNIVLFTRHDKREIGYWIDRHQWGKGIASAALALYLAKTSQRPLYARVASDNMGSRHVVEKQGFVVVAEEEMFDNARGEQIVEVLYELR